MQAYQILELERLSGIKAHTIRIWEKRYNLIKPHRTSTNRRYYDDEQARKLMNVATLLTQGYKISKIAAFSTDEINQRILSSARNDTFELRKTNLVNTMIKAMISLNEVEFDGAMVDAIVSFGLYEAVLQVVYPFLQKTGILWSANKAAPVQEHFASNIIRRKLLAAIDGVPVPQNENIKFLLLLPPGEWHETGLLLADYIIRSEGYKSVYLGQNVPFDNIEDTLSSVCPDYIITFYIAHRPVKIIEHQLKQLSAACKDSKILVAGSPELLSEAKTTGKNITYLARVDDLQDIINHHTVK